MSHPRPDGLRLVAILVLAAAPDACRGRQGASAERGPLILISVDTLRSDHLPTYGYRGIRTPAFDALASDSIVFNRAFSHCPLTLPSHASLFTGLLPPAHGVRNNKGYALEPSQETLAERLQAAGYRTAGFVSSMVLRPETGIAQGFEVYDTPGDERKRILSQRRGEATVARALAWLDGVKPGDRFFLFLHLFDPHTPWKAPPPFDAAASHPYDGEIAYTDHVLGRFLSRLKERGLYEPSLVVLLSDHGEGLGDHVEQEHGLLLYRETLQVPLFLKLPRQKRAGERTPGPASLSDLGTTVLGLLGIPGALGHGLDLFALKPPPADRPIYSETWFGREQYGWSELRSVIRGDGHFVDAPRPELYDWGRDPGEKQNLVPRVAVPPLFTQALAEVGSGRAATKTVTREEDERLAALGYVGGPTSVSAAPSERGPDPKDHIGQVAELWAQMEKVGETDSLEPETRVKQLLKELGIQREYLSRTIANNLLKAGRPAPALEILAPFAESAEAETDVVRGEVLVALGRPGAARTAFQTALRIAPGDARARRGLGIVALSTGRTKEALTWLEGAVEGDPALADAWNALGVARAQAGDLAGAVLAWRKTVELDPTAGPAWFNLGLALEKTGDRPGAVQALERYLPLAEGSDRATAQHALERLRSGV